MILFRKWMLWFEMDVLKYKEYEDYDKIVFYGQVLIDTVKFTFRNCL